MFLQQVEIANFRGIKNLLIVFDDVTVLIGENNTGKTTILDALQLCLSRSLTRKGGIFTEYDYHLPDKDSQPSDAEPIEISFRFAEKKEGEWPDEVIQMLSEAIQVDEEGRQSLTLRVTSRFDELLDDFNTVWDFLDSSGHPLPKAKNPRNVFQLQQLAPVFYLAALRDAVQEFRPRSQFWGPFVRTMKIESELREELEKDLSELNKRILDAHRSFDSVKERLKNTTKLMPLGNEESVIIEALPGKVFDMLSRTQVMLTSKTGARLPIGRHGEGTQSLAVICLFDAFLQSRLEEGYDKHTAPILALEEPESHLHPSAIRSVAGMLQKLKGQKVIATHSGDLVASVPLASLRRLRRKDGVITIHQVQAGVLDLNKLDYHLRLTRGNLLFSHCWILVEGEADHIVFNECSRINGHDLFSEGVCCVEFSTAGVEQFIKLADQLGIDWLVVADNDHAGQQYLTTASAQLNGRPQGRHLHKLNHGDMETYMCMEGYGAVFEANVSPQKQKTITKTSGTVEYWKQVIKARQRTFTKPKAMTAICKEIKDRKDKGESDVPEQITRIVDTALQLAKESK